MSSKRMAFSASFTAFALLAALGLGATARFFLSRGRPLGVGAFGGRAGLTPNIDGLAASGLRLTRACTSAPLTLPAHASIFTAVSPPVHGLRANGLFRLGPAQQGAGTVRITLRTVRRRSGLQMDRKPMRTSKTEMLS